MKQSQPPAVQIPQLVILIGIQATGKTSFYRDHYLGSHVRISLDLLRTRHRESAFLSLCMETGMDAVIDNTNPAREDRARYIARAKSAGFRVSGFYFQSRISDALARNSLRSGDARIPDAGILGCAKRMEMPERNEGFDELFYVTTLPEGGFQIQEWNDGLR